MNRTRLYAGALGVVASATCLLILTGVLAEVDRPRDAPSSFRQPPLTQLADRQAARPEQVEGSAVSSETLGQDPLEGTTPNAAPGADEDEAVIELKPLEEEKPSTWEEIYEGNNLQITDRGKPVEGVEVRLYDPRLIGGTPVELARSDAQGVVRFDSAELGVRVFDGPPPRFLAPGETGTFDFDEQAEFPLEGSVVGPDNEPVPDAYVSLQLGAFGLSAARSDGSGAFVLLASGSTGTLVVAAEGYLPARVSLATLRKTGNQVRLLRGDRGALGGAVIDETGQPLPGVLVRATSGTGGFLLAETDTFGRFGFDHLAAGPIVLQVHRGEIVPVVQQTAEVRARDVTEVVVRVTRRGTFALRVVRGAEPVANADVRITDSGVTRYGSFETNATNQTGRTDAEGWARFELPAGSYYARVVVEGDDHTLGGAVTGGQVTELSLDVADPRRLDVHVIDPLGNPVAGVFMDVSVPGINWSGMPSARTNGDGIGHFPQLPKGLAEVHLGKGGLWRMVRSDTEKATFVWTEATTLRVQGRVGGQATQLLAVTVLPDVAQMHKVELQGGDLDTTFTVPAGAKGVFLLPPDQGLAPVALGDVPASGEVSGFQVEFQAAGLARGVLTCGGKPVAGRVVLGGRWGGVHEARVQWTTGTDHDEWITVNEWVQATGPDGAFVLSGLAPGPHVLQLSAIGCQPRSVSLTVEPGGAVELGALELDAAK